MNERIRELADQLGPVATIGNWGRVEWSDNVYPQLGDKMYAAIDLEKFAELIVRECIEQVITGPNGPAHYAVEAAIRLKKHFGVEE
jgi:hypothetical protein